MKSGASAALLGVLAAFACSAPEGADAEKSPDSPKNDAFKSVNADGDACHAEPGRGVLRRLTDAEYQSTLAALFGRQDFPEAHPLTGNVVPDSYSTNADGLWVRDLDFQAIRGHAVAIGQWASTTDPAMVTDCSELNDACADDTVRNFGRRAFRRPLTDEQAERYVPIFLAGESFEQGLSMLVATMLQSPYFLYRSEVGEGADDPVSLGDFELGTSLAYYMTGAPPDTELTTVMESGELKARWQEQVDRLATTPEAEEKLIDFVIEWLGLDEVLVQTKTEAEFTVTPSLRASMMGEVEALVRHVVQTGGGFQDLLTNDYVFVNAELAEHYGISGPTGEEFEKVPAGNRTGGLLGTGAYLLGHSRVDSSSPTLRGLFVRERLLCEPVPPPPPTVNTELPPLEENTTTRQRSEQHLTDPVCASCHQGVDNFGHAFESYDGLGRFRTEENGLEVDTTGSTFGLESGEVDFEDSHELVSILVDDEQVERCFHQHLTEFVVGQKDWDNLCSVNFVASSAEQSGGSIVDSWKAIFSLPHLEARLAQGDLK